MYMQRGRRGQNAQSQTKSVSAATSLVLSEILVRQLCATPDPSEDRLTAKSWKNFWLRQKPNS